MKPTSFSIPILLGLCALTARGEIPTSELYPFPGFDLVAVRTKTKAEWQPDSADLREAWRLYRDFQGAWVPGARKPEPATVAFLDRLKNRLESRPKPDWFLAAQQSPALGQAQLADKVGDATFERQKVTPDYQALKALAIVYLAEHELDRADAAQKAGRCLTVLSLTHPWDWEVHGLYSRLLLDARLNGPAWAAARQSLFLNPDPTVEELKFFAFIGSIAAKGQWPEIQTAMRQAAIDPEIAERAITDSARLFPRRSRRKSCP